MPTATKTPGDADTLNREMIIAMLEDLREVQSLELKMTVPGRQRSAVRTLELDAMQGKLREVYFFDTPELALFESGLVMRARRTQRAADDTVVKLRPAVPAELDPEVQASPNLKIEMDATRGRLRRVRVDQGRAS